MKRMLAMLMAISAMLLVLFMMTAGALADGGEDNLAVVYNPNPADRLNLRVSPSKGAQSIAKYYSGAEVVLLGEEKNGWVYVSAGLLDGYMDATYLRTGDAASGVVSAMPTVTIANSGGTGANLRTKPGEDGRVILLIANGTRITAKGVTPEGWLHVMIGDTEGFIRADLATPRLAFDLTQTDGGVHDGGEVAIVSTTSPADRLNLRTAPGGDAPSLCKYYRGVVVTLLSGAEDGWYHVDIEGMRGYVKDDFIAFGTRAQAQAMSAMPTVTARRGNTPLYAQMSYNSKRLTTLAAGEAVTVLGVSTDYLHVRTQGGTTGFVLLDAMTPELKFDLSK